MPTPEERLAEVTQETMDKFKKGSAQASARAAAVRQGKLPPGAPMPMDPADTDDAPVEGMDAPQEPTGPQADMMLSTDTKTGMLEGPDAPQMPRGMIADAPPEAVRIIDNAMSRGGSTSDLLAMLRGSGFVIRREQQALDQL